MKKEIIVVKEELNGRWEKEKLECIIELIEKETKNIDNTFIILDLLTYTLFKTYNLIVSSDDAVCYVVNHSEDIDPYLKKKLKIKYFKVLPDGGKWFEIGSISENDVPYGINIYESNSEISIFSNKEEICKIILKNFTF